MVVPVLMTSCQGIGEAKERAADRPHDDHPDRDSEYPSAAHLARCHFGNRGKHSTEWILPIAAGSPGRSRRLLTYSTLAHCASHCLEAARV
jgi:hypothetical protein